MSEKREEGVGQAQLLQEVLDRSRRTEDLLARLYQFFLESPLAFAQDNGGSGGESWKYLEWRRHPWRRQPYLKGRNMTVRQVLGVVRANKLSPKEAADDLDLPVEAIREALQFAEEYKDLLESDDAFERHLLAQRGHGRGAPSVS